jgi:hypothetical protein
VTRALIVEPGETRPQSFDEQPRDLAVAFLSSSEASATLSKLASSQEVGCAALEDNLAAGAGFAFNVHECFTVVATGKMDIWEEPPSI